MAVVYPDRVHETTTTTGTGTYSLGGAKTGFQTFVAGVGGGNQCYYAVDDGSDWEVGLGTVTDASPDTLSRDTILASSNSGSAVNWGSGSKDIYSTIPADQIPPGSDQELLYNNDGAMGAASVLTWNGTVFGVDAAAVFNESGADVDFRVESADEPNMLLVDAAENQLNLGTAANPDWGRLNVAPRDSSGASNVDMIATFSDSTDAANVQAGNTDVWGVRLGNPTINSGGGGLTITNAAAAYVPGPLQAGTDVTITNNWALMVASGASMFCGELVIDDSHELRLRELSANGSNYVGFTAPDSLSGNQVWELPGSDGAANQTITTNASGVLAFANAEAIATGLAAGSIVFSDGSTLTEDASNLFFDSNNARLGVGTGSPSDNLHVEEASSNNCNIRLTNGNASSNDTIITGSAGTSGRLRVQPNTGFDHEMFVQAEDVISGSASRDLLLVLTTRTDNADCIVENFGDGNNSDLHVQTRQVAAGTGKIRIRPQLTEVAVFDENGSTFTGTVNLPAGAVDAIGEIASGLRSGSDTTLITGTAGTSGDLSQWNADGDLVDGPTPPSGTIVGTSDSQTLSNKTLGSALDASNNDVTNLRIATFNGVVDNGTSGATATLDWTTGAMQKITVTDDLTLSFTDPPSVGRFRVKLIYDATGGHDITWPAPVVWPEGEPTWTNGTANQKAVVVFDYDGTEYVAIATSFYS